MESRESLINQIALLHEEKEHQKIIALIEGQPPAAMDYELTSLLARAYINYAQPYMDSFQEHIKHAVELLRSVEAEGMADPQWYYRIGTALYWQDEEESALTYLEQCVAMDPTNEDAPEIIAECKAAISRRTIVRPLNVQRLIDYFDRNDFNYRVEDQSLHMGIGRGYFIFSIANDGTDLSMWAAIPEDVSMELRQRPLRAHGRAGLDQHRAFRRVSRGLFQGSDRTHSRPGWHPGVALVRTFPGLVDIMDEAGACDALTRAARRR